MRIRSALRPALRSAVLVLALDACGGAAAPEREDEGAGSGAEHVAFTEPDPAPEGQLPDGVDPTHYRLALRIDPREERFSGVLDVRVTLEAATNRIWMHGAGLTVTQASISPGFEDAAGVGALTARWEPSERDEVAALRFDTPIGPGEATIHLEYDAPFDRQLKGLYRVDVGDDRYAFTQFEATSARFAFPCFDEPRWKTPFSISIAAPTEDRVVANTIETSATPDEEAGFTRHVFADSLPLPTYLLAMAVGPLDIVEAPPIPANDVRTRPLPFRGVAARGRGAELAYALEHTPAIVAALERYMGMEYPYDKLDIIAVPDFASGAMENAGAITFREQLLLLDDSPPEEQVRWFTNVMAHELAHQWFGDLVTMPWWNDIWLNEAFATWMATRIVREVAPEQNADVSAVASIHYAMASDSLEAARSIRQPIESDHDIRNAFDSITYQKGMGVLGMFEHHLGEDRFRDAIRAYLTDHRFGTARGEELLGALSVAAGRDIATPFFTFLDQPGVPLVTAHLACGAGGRFVDLTQRRYLPVGSTASTDPSWQIPVCVRYGSGRTTGEVCTLLTGPSGRVTIPGDTCPEWIMPNAGAVGYYRFALPATDLASLLEDGWSHLTAAERLSVANNLRAAFAANATTAGDLFPLLSRVAADDDRLVATEPFALLTWVVDDLASAETRAAARTWAGSLYAARWRRLGWTPGRRENGETALFRRDLASFLVRVARDERVRGEAATRGRAYLGVGGDGAIHQDAVSVDLVVPALIAAVNVPPDGAARGPGSSEVFDAMTTHLFASEDAILRQRLLVALGSIEDDPELAERAIALGIDPRVRVNESLTPLQSQVDTPEGRERALTYVEANFDTLFARVATTRAGYAPLIFSGFCDEPHRTRVETFFTARIDTLPGAPRNLRAALEAISLCAARDDAHTEAVTAFLAAR